MAKSDKTQDENLNTKCFSDLLFLAKGKRSSIDFCNECGISPSMFSRYLNQKNKRSCPIEILKKVAAHAAPESGVTFDILVAHAHNAWHALHSDRPAPSDRESFHDALFYFCRVYAHPKVPR